MFTEAGFTVKESVECGASANMALLTMARYSSNKKSYECQIPHSPPPLELIVEGWL